MKILELEQLNWLNLKITERMAELWFIARKLVVRETFDHNFDSIASSSCIKCLESVLKFKTVSDQRFHIDLTLKFS